MCTRYSCSRCWYIRDIYTYLYILLEIFIHIPDMRTIEFFIFWRYSYILDREFFMLKIFISYSYSRYSCTRDNQIFLLKIFIYSRYSYLRHYSYIPTQDIHTIEICIYSDASLESYIVKILIHSRYSYTRDIHIQDIDRLEILICSRYS